MRNLITGIDDMLKEEAIVLMIQGKKLTHRYFEPHEWMTMLGPDVILFEDNVKCTIQEFWTIRSEPEWNTDWSLWK